MYTPSQPRTLALSGAALPTTFDGKPVLVPTGLWGTEALGKLSQYTIEAKTPDALNFSRSVGANVDLDALVGTEVTVSIEITGIRRQRLEVGLARERLGRPGLDAHFADVQRAGNDDIFAIGLLLGIALEREAPARHKPAQIAVPLRAQPFAMQGLHAHARQMGRLRAPVVRLAAQPAPARQRLGKIPPLIDLEIRVGRIARHLATFRKGRELLAHTRRHVIEIGVRNLAGRERARYRKRIDMLFVDAPRAWSKIAELRTDLWGVLRAARGLLVSTEARSNAKNHAKDIGETVTRLTQARDIQESLAGLAQEHGAQQHDADQSDVARSLKEQNDAIRGSGDSDGKDFPEFTAPHLVLASPAGIETTTAGSTHIASDQNLALTTGGHIGVAAGKSFLASIANVFSVFVQKLGIMLVAASGKVHVEAQDDRIEIIAKKALELISTTDWIELRAKQGNEFSICVVTAAT